MVIPKLSDVYKARKIIERYLPRTITEYSSKLSELVGGDVYLKRDDQLPLGAFKVRGGLNILANLSVEERERGVITASTGNHGQSIANACNIFGAKAFIALPKGANPLKVEAIKSLGAELLFHGRNFDDAREYAERLAMQEGFRYIHPVNEPLIIAGVATQALEIVEDVPDVNAIFVPLGGGSGASGACIVAKSINPDIKVYAVQSESSSAGFLSWKQGGVRTAGNETFAEGLATGTGYDLPLSVLKAHLDDFILVTDDEIRASICLLIEKAHTLAEGAGAAALAGIIKSGEKLVGKKMVAVVSGGNITLDQLEQSIKSFKS